VTATALISDIHGEFPRLNRVLADIDRRGLSRIVSLGDNVDERAGGGPILAELLRRGIPSVLGNCDQLFNVPLGSDEEAYIQALPRELREGDVLFTHISPVAGARGLKDARDAAQIFRGTRQRVCFVGHIHIPAIFVDDADNALAVPFEYGVPITLDPARKYAVCIGAVGRGRDGIAEPRYAIWDDAAQTVEIVRVV